MSLLFGTVGPNTDVYLQQMQQGMGLEPHLEAKVCTKESAAFGYLETKRIPINKQIFFDSETKVLFTGKGRLDNNTDLLAQWGLPPLSDAEIMYCAWKRWGKDCVHHLRGDWAFAVYTDEELFLARDPHGYTALYYYTKNDHLFFSTSPKGIFALKCFTKRLNKEQFLNDLLLIPTPSSENTGYSDLKMIPPAHTLVFSRGQVKLTRYWFPENIEVRNYKNPLRYAEELLEIFREAVNVRLDEQTAAMLSGGLDSGSVAAIAAELKKNTTLQTFSHIPLYDVSPAGIKNRTLDESQNILAAAAFSGNISTTLLSSAHTSPTQSMVEVVDKMDLYFHGASNAFWMIDIYKNAKLAGFDSILTGEMGNGSISFPGVKQLLPWHHAAVRKRPASWIKQNILSLLRYRLPYSPLRLEQKYANYTQASYLREHYKNEALKTLKDRSEHLNYNFPTAKLAMIKTLGIGTNLRCAMGQRMGDAYGIELRDPTGDLRVIEYCLSIPNEAFFSSSTSGKSILLDMMKNYLPQEVLYSPKKGLQSSDLVERFRNDRDGVEELLMVLSKNALVQEMFDVKHIQKDWLHLQQNADTALSQAQHFAKTLMFAYFLSKMDDL